MKRKVKKLTALALTALFVISGCNSAEPNVFLPDGDFSFGSVTSVSGEATEDSVIDGTQTDNQGNIIEVTTDKSEDNTNQATDGDPTAAPAPENPSETKDNSSGNNGNGSASGDSTTSSSTAENGTPGTSKSEFTVQWKLGGSWEEGSYKCGSAELIITNTGAAVSSWSVSFTVPDGFEITNSWSGNFSVNGNTVTVSNVEYNGSIPSGGSVNPGFNYKCPGDFTPPGSVEIGGTPDPGGNSGNNGGNNGNNNGGGSGGNNNPPPSGDVQELLKRSSNAKQGDDWLFTDGNKVVDKNGKQVWLTGVNWFGYNTGTNTFDGLWNSELVSTVTAIADHGFNLIRVPISAQLLNQWAAGEYPRANYNNAYNPTLNDMNSLQIFEYFLKLAEENGMKVMPDIHSAETDAQGHNTNLWYTDKVSEEEYYRALEWLADRYKDNDTIIAIDLKNEPHGKPYETNKAIWNNSTAKNNWKHTAETAAKRIFAKNPNVLVMIEGIEIFPTSKSNMDYSSTNEKDYYFNWWGGNLRGVKDYPIDVGKFQNKVVYSPHDYGPTVYQQPWFKGSYDYNSLTKDCWQDNWLYIHKDKIAPLLIGEWGGFMREPNLKWMTCLRRLIKEYHLNHTFWCINANSGDTGGLLLDDFITWDTEKYEFVKEVLWQEGGKFVGLDHAIPLGKNGITLSQAKGL